MSYTRRRFLHRALRASAALAIGCGSARGDGSDSDDIVESEDSLAGGELVRILRFEDENQVVYNEQGQYVSGGGLVADLSALTPENLLMSNERFFIRTIAPDDLDPAGPWSIRVRGLVDADMTLTMQDLMPFVRPQGSFVLECSGNRGSGFGLMSAASWDGVLIEDLLKMLSPKTGATRLLVSSQHSTSGASWIFSFDQLVEAGAFLATHMNGKILPPDHGAPLRLYIPGWYGCAAIKWVNELRLVGENEPATAQMKEFASRTHQRGVPDLARDYRAAMADQAAMPVRIEQWRVGAVTRYRVVGILWGGQKVFDQLTLRFNPGEPFVPVQVSPAMQHNQPWTLWSTIWVPPGPGRYRMRARIDDWSIPTRRLDQGWYDREVVIS
jgi:DMSO/TMAO reductase YedYZ molybdopterin-dependent catalytic subunit